MNFLSNKENSFFDSHLLLTSLIAAFGILITFIFLSPVNAATLINGAGATFPEPIYVKWFSEYQKVDKDISFNYQGVGSGGGIRQLIARTVDFGASDSPMTEDEVKSAKTTVFHFPTVLGAVVVAYNLKLDKPLNLSGALVGDIFAGKIVKWNDPRIAKENSGLKLPDLAITVATRSDGSGTTAVFTDYLSKVNPDWKCKASKTVDWFKGTIGAKGNAGVAGLIKQGEGCVGYIEYVYAVQNKLPFANIQNKKGEYIQASNQSITAAAGGSVVKEMEKNDFKLSITDSKEKGAYPISSFTWLLVYENMKQDKGQPIVKMLKWLVGEEAQKMAETLNYSSLPKELRTKIISKINTIKLD